MSSYTILCFKNDQKQEFFLCEDFKEVQALEEQLRSDPNISYYEVHVYAMIKSWTKPLDTF